MIPLQYRFISFSGRKGSGKSLLTQYLKEKYNYKIINFADELKKLTCSIFNISMEELESTKDVVDLNILSFINNNFENICKIIHEETSIDIVFITHILLSSNIKSIRTFLQIVGTDIIRTYNPDWHIEKIKENLNIYDFFCFSDTRFINEKKFIEQLNGRCFFIIRPDNFNISHHVSETQLTWKDFPMNNILINNLSKQYFKENFENALFGLSLEFNYKYNNSCFYEKPDDKIYNILLKNGMIKKRKNMCFLTLKNCNVDDTKLFISYLNNINEFDHGDNDCNDCNDENDELELYCDNPFIIENLKKYIKTT